MKTIYKIQGNSTVAYRTIESTDGNTYVLPESVFEYDLYVLDKSKDVFYETKVESMLELFKTKIECGKKLKNYKSSPYYNDYYKLCLEEYPEQLI